MKKLLSQLVMVMSLSFIACDGIDGVTDTEAQMSDWLVAWSMSQNCGNCKPDPIVPIIPREKVAPIIEKVEISTSKGFQIITDPVSKFCLLFQPVIFRLTANEALALDYESIVIEDPNGELYTCHDISYTDPKYMTLGYGENEKEVYVVIDHLPILEFLCLTKYWTITLGVIDKNDSLYTGPYEVKAHLSW
jgi:hypothetical protein